MPTYISSRGNEMLRERLQKMRGNLRQIRREKAIAYTASGDTWHDNPGFNALEQTEKRQVEELSELENILASSTVVNIEPRPMNTVRLGAIVRCSRFDLGDLSETEEVWEIVGYGESDPGARRISYESPIASSLMGLAPGDARQVRTPSGAVEYTVISLHPNWESANLNEKEKEGE